MIVRYEQERTLVDVETLCLECRSSPDAPPRSPATIRKHCLPVAVDVETDRLLYDLDECLEIMSQVPQRSPRRRRQRGLTNDRL